MIDENSVTKARTWPKKVLQIIWIGCISFAALFFVARLTWRFSGSNQWEFIALCGFIQLWANSLV